MVLPNRKIMGNNSVAEDTSYTRIVVGSIPTSPISCRVPIMVLEQIANLSVVNSACRFESYTRRFGTLGQLVEQSAVNQYVAGSIPASSVLYFEN